MKKKILAIVICLAVLLGVTATLLLTPGLWDKIFGKNITVGIIEQEYLSYYNSDGVPTGISVDIANQIFEDLGYKKIEFVSVMAEEAYQKLEKGKIDCLLDCVTKPNDKVALSSGYASFTQSVFATTTFNKGINFEEELLDYRAGYITSTTADKYFGEIGISGAKGYADYASALSALKNGEIDFICADEYRMADTLKDTENYAEYSIGRSFYDEDYRMAFKAADTALLEQVNGEIKKLKDNGLLKTYAERYIDAEYIG